jgi:hypothetical protein
MDSIVTVFVGYNNTSPPSGTDEYDLRPDLDVDKRIDIAKYGILHDCSIQVTSTNSADPYRYYDMFRAVSAGIAYAKEIGADYVLRHRIDIRIQDLQLTSIRPRICYALRVSGFQRLMPSDNIVFGDIGTLAEVFKPPASPLLSGGDITDYMSGKKLHPAWSVNYVCTARFSSEFPKLDLVMLKPDMQKNGGACNQRSSGFRRWNQESGHTEAAVMSRNALSSCLKDGRVIVQLCVDSAKLDIVKGKRGATRGATRPKGQR